MDKCFKAFKIHGVQFLVFPNNNTSGSIKVIDEDGNFYGSYFSEDSFRKFMKAEGHKELVLGTGTLQYRENYTVKNT